MLVIKLLQTLPFYQPAAAAQLEVEHANDFPPA
jgi:hypothetical protein